MTTCFRPGGIALTKQLLEKVNLAPHSKVLDLGCGQGDTVSLLNELGYDAIGIDLDIAIQSLRFL